MRNNWESVSSTHSDIDDSRHRAERGGEQEASGRVRMQSILINYKLSDWLERQLKCHGPVHVRGVNDTNSARYVHSCYQDIA